MPIKVFAETTFVGNMSRLCVVKRTKNGIDTVMQASINITTIPSNEDRRKDIKLMVEDRNEPTDTSLLPSS